MKLQTEDGLLVQELVRRAWAALPSDAPPLVVSALEEALGILAQAATPRGHWLTYPEHVPPRVGAYCVRLADGAEHSDHWHLDFEWCAHPDSVAEFFVSLA